MYIQNVSAAEFEAARRSAVRIAAAKARRCAAHLDSEVLVNTAELAVWQAAIRYRPRPGSSFVPFALWLARNQVNEELRRQSPWTLGQCRERRAWLEAGHEPEGWMQEPLPLHTPPPGFDSGRGVLEDAVPDRDAYADAERRIEREETLASLAPALVTLDDRRRTVVVRYYLLNEPTRSIAASLGVTVSRVQQLRSEALAKLRAFLTAEVEGR